MNIVKKYEFEMAHIVRNAYTRRCSHSIHGHTYTAEIGLAQDHKRKLDELKLDVIDSQFTDILDGAQMIVDFGHLKSFVKPFIDSFDHTTLLWSKDEPEVIEFFKNNFERVIIMPVSSSCEMMSMIFAYTINRLFDEMDSITIESDMPVDSPLRDIAWPANSPFRDIMCNHVTIHETSTGRAVFNLKDLNYEAAVLAINTTEKVFNETWFSDAIQKDWPIEFKYLMAEIFKTVK